MHRVAILIVLVLAVAGVARAQDDPQAIIQQLQQRVAELEKENADLRKQLGIAEEHKDALAKEKESLAKEKEALAKEKQALAVKNEDLNAEREQLEKLAGVTSKGEQVETAVALVDTKYSAESGNTSVTFKPRRIESNGSGPFSIEHYLGVGYRFAGETMQTPPETVDLRIYTFFHPTSAYKSVNEADIVIDGQESVTVPLASYEIIKTRKPPAAVKRGETRYDELLVFNIDADTLRRLATAQEAVLKLPGNDLVLTRDHLALLAGARQRISQGL